MGKIILGMASSHANALLEPKDWDIARERTRARYQSRHGKEAPPNPKIAGETSDDRERRYERIRKGFKLFHDQLREKKPDALIIVGDDQNENFTTENLPQIAIYTGDRFLTGNRQSEAHQTGSTYSSHAELAREIHNGLVEREFDVASAKTFAHDELRAHAHGPILQRVLPEADIPVLLLFVNAIHVPAIGPRRCYRLGEAIREIVSARPNGERVAIYASGGLSHFTAGYPWKHYQGPYDFGSISEEFDRKALKAIEAGEAEQLASLSADDLLLHGDIEMRSWLVLLGALGKTKPSYLAYEPFYSALMGMGTGYWEPS